jgi:hypothetical protein
MTRRHRHRLATVLFALMSLLFMQLATAGYLCPAASATLPTMAAEMTMADEGTPCNTPMVHTLDQKQPSLCHAHCKADPQTADKYQLPVLASLADLSGEFPLPRLIPAPLSTLLQAPLLRRTTVPPLAVRNCCFRI